EHRLNQLALAERLEDRCRNLACPVRRGDLDTKPRSQRGSRGARTQIGGGDVNTEAARGGLARRFPQRQATEWWLEGDRVLAECRLVGARRGQGDPLQPLLRQRPHIVGDGGAS